MKKILIAALYVVAFSASAATCYTFAGKKYCPEEGKPFVLPCTNTGCLSEQPMPDLPPPPVTAVSSVVTAVVAPVDANGKPAEYVNLCTQSGCSVSKAPVVAVETLPPPPPTVWWVQPPPVAVGITIGWGPMQGTGNWNLPSGPPLRRHR